MKPANLAKHDFDINKAKTAFYKYHKAYEKVTQLMMEADGLRVVR